MPNVITDNRPRSIIGKMCGRRNFWATRHRNSNFVVRSKVGVAPRKDADVEPVPEAVPEAILEVTQAAPERITTQKAYDISPERLAYWETYYAYLKGKTFGDLTVDRIIHQNKHWNFVWECHTSAGVVKLHTTKELHKIANISRRGGYYKAKALENVLRRVLGEKFNTLRIIDSSEDNVSGNYEWLCKCDTCGDELIITVSRNGPGIKNEHVHEEYEVPNKSPDKSLVGKRFGKLTVIDVIYKNKRSMEVYAHCRCDCGAETYLLPCLLKRGNNKSCGCLRGAPRPHSLEEIQQKPSKKHKNHRKP